MKTNCDLRLEMKEFLFWWAFSSWSRNALNPVWSWLIQSEKSNFWPALHQAAIWKLSYSTLTYCGFCKQLISKDQCFSHLRRSQKSLQACNILSFLYILKNTNMHVACELLEWLVCPRLSHCLFISVSGQHWFPVIFHQSFLLKLDLCINMFGLSSCIFSVFRQSKFTVAFHPKLSYRDSGGTGGAGLAQGLAVVGHGSRMARQWPARPSLPWPCWTPKWPGEIVK